MLSGMYAQDAQQKKQLIATFLEKFKGNPRIRVNLIKIKILHFLIAVLASVQGAL